MSSATAVDGVARYLAALHEMAEVSVDSSKPIRLYVRSAESVFKQACIYRSENDLEKAFILFLKYSKYDSTRDSMFTICSLFTPTALYSRSSPSTQNMRQTTA